MIRSLLLSAICLIFSSSINAQNWVQGGKLWKGPATTFAAAYSQPNTAGNLLVLALRGANQPAVTDSAGDTWQSTPDLRFWWTTAKGGVNTVTLTCGSLSILEAVFGEYSGAYAFDVQAGRSGNNLQSGTSASVLITTSAPNELVVGYGENGTTDGPTLMAGAGFTLREQQNIFIEDEIAPTAGPVNVSVTYGSPVGAYQYAVAFKSAGPPPPPVLSFPGAGTGKGFTATFMLTNVAQMPSCTAADGNCSLIIRFCTAATPPVCISGPGSLTIEKDADSGTGTQMLVNVTSP